MPAAPESTCREFIGMVDDIVCASMPTPFLAVGESFWDFSQVSDEEVRELLTTPTTGATPVGQAEQRAADLVLHAAIDAPRGVPPREVLDELIGDARIVLIGESSHGTHEFYEARAEITKWLIEQKGFNAVAAEADWPDAYRVNRYVRSLGDDASAEEALRGFERFPAWMWRNVVVARLHPAGCAGTTSGVRPTGRARPASTVSICTACTARCTRWSPTSTPSTRPRPARARARYACFDHSAGDDGQAYGYAAAFGAGQSCERQAVEQLRRAAAQRAAAT